MTNTSSPPSQEEIDKMTATFFPPDWFKANPNYQEYIPLAKKPVFTCDALSNITHLTLVIVGTDDIWTLIRECLSSVRKSALVEIRLSFPVTRTVEVPKCSFATSKALTQKVLVPRCEKIIDNIICRNEVT
ncbi:MAG: hypothetical protein WA941_14300 [Nitrososphaeraceae archaeon]